METITTTIQWRTSNDKTHMKLVSKLRSEGWETVSDVRTKINEEGDFYIRVILERSVSE
jgi:hypothetical protein